MRFRTDDDGLMIDETRRGGLYMGKRYPNRNSAPAETFGMPPPLVPYTARNSGIINLEDMRTKCGGHPHHRFCSRVSFSVRVSAANRENFF